MESLYSRQIGVLGSKTMKQMSNLKVIVLGCDTIGTEMAKSLVLMGVNKIYLFDNTPYNKIHYGRLLEKSSNGTKLSVVCKIFLDNLHTSTTVEVVTKKSEAELLIKKKKINVVVLTKNKDISKVEELCVKTKIPFIFGYNSELIGYIFVNFGKWEVLDKDGEPVFQSYIHSKQILEESIILKFKTSEIPNSKKFKLSNKKEIVYGELIKTEIESNFNEKYLVVTLKKEENISNILLYPNLLYTEVKSAEKISHLKFKKYIKKNNYQYIDTESSFNRNDDLYKNYTKFILTNNTNHYPSDFVERKDNKFYLLGAMIGGLLAQEVIKTTHKYTPITQDILFNFRNLFGKEKYKSGIKFTDIGCLLDKKLIIKMKKIKAFMIGCGALGCEISKNLGMMGFCGFKNSNLTITDMDSIELSNLTRQFLFQKEDIGEQKSDVVKKKLVKYCPNLNVNSYNEQVGPNNENKFNYKFWENKSIIINALDNVEARQYVDSKCVIFKKPLFESGTLGVKGNVQVIIPGKTATYSEIVDPPEKNVPMCTIRNFPNNINHCIEWSLNIFDKLFNTGLRDMNKFIDSKDEFIRYMNDVENEKECIERYNLVYYLFNAVHKKNILSITQLVNFIYKYYFTDIIKEILETHPVNSMDDDGKLFWSGNKIKPNLIDSIDILEKQVFISISTLLDIDIEITHIPINNNISIMDKTCINRLSEGKKSYLRKPLPYDKDNDIHMTCLVHLTNIRAVCYNIPEGETIDIKLISGKIIPALSTTTSIISALVVLDIIKYLAGIQTYSETNINIGVNAFTRYKAFKPKITYNNMFHPDYGMDIKTAPCHFSTWDTVCINGNKNSVNTNIELYHYIKDTHDIGNIEMITSESFIIYSDRTKQVRNMKEIYTYYKKMKGYNISFKEPLLLEVMSFDKDLVPVLIPNILFTLL